MQKEEKKFTNVLTKFLEKYVVYDGNNILIIHAPNIAKTWVRIDELITHGFILKSSFAEIDGQDNTYYFELPDWRKRYDPFPESDT